MKIRTGHETAALNGPDSECVLCMSLQQFKYNTKGKYKNMCSV